MVYDIAEPERGRYARKEIPLAHEDIKSRKLAILYEIAILIAADNPAVVELDQYKYRPMGKRVHISTYC